MSSVVARLGIDGRLATTLTTSNPVEIDDLHCPHHQPQTSPAGATDR